MRTGEDNWGPWAKNITDAERLARLRSLRTVAECMFGSGTPLAPPLERAESLDPVDLETALLELNRMPALDRRKLLAGYQRVNLKPRRAAA